MACPAFTRYLCLSSLLVWFVSANGDFVGFENNNMTVPENIGQVKFCVRFYRNVQLSCKGRVFTTNPDRDEPVTYVGNFSENIHLFTPANLSKCLDASVLDNNILEFGKIYFLNISIVSNAFIKHKEGQETLTITITDDDTVSIGFFQTSITVSESDGYASVCMNRVGEARNLGQEPVPAEALSVRLSTVDGTASRNEDFTPLDSMLVDFGLNETSKCIDVSLNIDNVLENMETFYITMTNGSSFVMVNETRSNLTVNIRKEEKVTAQFEETYNKEIKENFDEGEVELVCVIDRAVRIPVQIGFSVDNFTSTAVMGSDFTLENKSLTFPPNQKKMTLKIKINRDGQAESTEILVVRMVSLDGNLVTIGKNDTAKVKITDQMDNDNEAAKIKDLENGRRREIYTLLIVAIVLIAVLFICGIVFCICFIKSRAN